MRYAVDMIRCLLIVWMVFGGVSSFAFADDDRPNVIVILADDLGYGELGCYGQTKIRTPRIDALAASGARFTQAYAGAPVCAPSRAVLLTGTHTGHTAVRANRENGGWGPDEPEGQMALPAGTPTLAHAFQANGYATCAIGKWGLGGPDSDGAPNACGFDHWFGYLCQRVAHNFYPTHLWRNGEKVLLGNTYFSAHQRLESPPESYDAYAGSDFSPDAMIDEALQWVTAHRDQPFFLYFATPVPHVALQVPDESLAPYPESWDDTPYLGERSYLPHPRPRAAYAAMISRMDRDIGRLVDRLEALDLRENTLIIVTSDNGPTYAGGVDYEFFESAGGLRGLKGSLDEGGLRVPMVVSWPAVIDGPRTVETPVAFPDLWPTAMGAIGADDAPAQRDGADFGALLRGETDRALHQRSFYWEYRGGQAVRFGPWKGIRRRGQDAWELYHLGDDPAQQTNVADAHAEVVRRCIAIAAQSRHGSAVFPLQPAR